MIKCDFDTCAIKGSSILVEAEFAFICRSVREAFVEAYGKEEGMEKYRIAIELAEMSNEEVKECNEMSRAENPVAAMMADQFCDKIMSEITRMGEAK